MIVTRGCGSGACLICQGFGLYRILETLLMASAISLEWIKNSIIFKGDINLFSRIENMKKMESSIYIEKVKQLLSTIKHSTGLQSKITKEIHLTSKIKVPEK